jgi:uncharacterized protein (TIGR03435 family)
MPSSTKGRTYTAKNIAVRNLIASAYQVPTARVLGGPAWVGAANLDMRFVGGERFDISARLPEGTTARQVPEMLRALLAYRFKLTVHTEARVAPLYALVIARKDGRLGSQLRKASIDCDAAGTSVAVPDAAAGISSDLRTEDQRLCQLQIGGEILGRGQRLATLARVLSLFADRPVTDKTGLTGGFDFDLRFPELDTAADGARTEPISGLFTALEEQLGLKLQAIRDNLDFLVIDHVEHPTEN